MRMKGRQTILGKCCTRWMLYSVNAVLGVCGTQCQLMIMTWRDREGWLNFLYCDDGRVMDKQVRDGGWRWERCGGYERIWEMRGTICLIELGRPRISIITLRIGTHTWRIGDDKLLGVLFWQVTRHICWYVVTVVVCSLAGVHAGHISIGSAIRLADSLKAHCRSSWFDDVIT